MTEGEGKPVRRTETSTDSEKKNYINNLGAFPRKEVSRLTEEQRLKLEESKVIRRPNKKTFKAGFDETPPTYQISEYVPKKRPK